MWSMCHFPAMDPGAKGLSFNVAGIHWALDEHIIMATRRRSPFSEKRARSRFPKAKVTAARPRPRAGRQHVRRNPRRLEERRSSRVQSVGARPRQVPRDHPWLSCSMRFYKHRNRGRRATFFSTPLGSCNHQGYDFVGKCSCSGYGYSTTARTFTSPTSA